MFKVVSKLKTLKKPLRKLIYDQDNLHDRVNKLQVELDAVQKALDANPNDLNIREEEDVYLHAFNEAKNQRSRVDIIRDNSNNEFSCANVAEAFVSHYGKFHGCSMDYDNINSDELFPKKVSDVANSNMVRPISDEEIKRAMFDIGNDKALGPDGYTSAFFKKAWDIVGIEGDPLSPYLFTLVMEVLTLMLKRRVRSSKNFRYHHHCDKHHIINVCFADDLFIFARGDVASARVFMESLEEFKATSGLVPSIPKSTAFFCNVAPFVKTAILSIMPFLEGKLLVKYLGVPLISSRLLNKDCKVLVEKAKNRIGDWKNKSLSFAGRLQLCKLVISSMHVYWASVLVIPKVIIYDIQHLIRGFLWCNGEYKRGKAKVAWENICLPTYEGGLGLRSLEVFNKALITKHIWNIVTNKESLWVRWIHAVKLRGRSFWAIPLNDADMSWGWRKLLQLRDLGFTLQCHNGWVWPQAWLLKAPNLGLTQAPQHGNVNLDTYHWRDSNGNLKEFSVRCAWEPFRSRGNAVGWYRLVWFTHCIPRHSFHICIVMRNSLRTQDKLRLGDIGYNMICCPLCKVQPDLHSHLFFECSFSSQIWLYVRHLADMDVVPPLLHDITLHLQLIAKQRMAKSVFDSRILLMLLICLNDGRCLVLLGFMVDDVIIMSDITFYNLACMEDLVRVGLSRLKFHMRVVLFFPSPRFFPRGFSWEGFFKEAISFKSLSSRHVSIELVVQALLELDKDNDKDKIGIKQSSEDIFVEPLRNVISTDTYAHVSNELKET
ncbi:uncharacterized protein Tco_0150154, partial [Tanacetum coccineum]